MSYSMLWLGDGWQSGHSSALYGETPNAPSSIDNTVQALRAAGIPDAKIGIGIDFYGESVEKRRLEQQWMDASRSAAISGYVTEPHQSTATAFTRYGDNALSYLNIMRYLHSGTAYRWDDMARVPYLSWSTPPRFDVPGSFSNLRPTFVTYDNEPVHRRKGLVRPEQQPRCGDDLDHQPGIPRQLEDDGGARSSDESGRGCLSSEARRDSMEKTMMTRRGRGTRLPVQKLEPARAF